MKTREAISTVDKLAGKSAQWFVIVLVSTLVALLAWDSWDHRRKCDALQADNIEFLKTTVTQVNRSLDRAADALDKLSRK